MQKNVFFRYRDYPDSWSDNAAFRMALAVQCGSDEYRTGFSFCNKLDARHYDKDKARSLALDRLNDEKSVVIVSQREVDFYQGLFNAALVKVLSSTTRPSWFPTKLWAELDEVSLVLDTVY